MVQLSDKIQRQWWTDKFTYFNSIKYLGQTGKWCGFFIALNLQMAAIFHLTAILLLLMSQDFETIESEDCKRSMGQLFPSCSNKFHLKQTSFSFCSKVLLYTLNMGGWVEQRSKRRISWTSSTCIGTNINQTMKLLCKVLSSKKLYNLNGKVKCTETYFNNNLIFLLSLI